MRTYRAIVIGSSTGGLKALEVILRELPEDFPIPVAIVQHLSPDQNGLLASILSSRGKLLVKEAEDKEPVRSKTVYVASPNYHLLVETDGTFSLSVDEKENYSRPSIDVLFESAAEAFSGDLIGVILTGASPDGAQGLKRISQDGGLTIVQDPNEAEANVMPLAAIRAVQPDHILPLEQIASLLIKIAAGSAVAGASEN